MLWENGIFGQGIDVDEEFRNGKNEKKVWRKNVEKCAGLALVIIEKVRMEGTVTR
jgi:hypothetical protein